MKYKCLNGWTPHSVFSAATGSGYNDIPGIWYRYNRDTGAIHFEQPFRKKTLKNLVKFCKPFENKHEALARWLVANTEGDW